MKIYVACAANNDIPQEYVDDCKKIFNKLFIEHDLIFGACDRSIMGLAYQTAKANGRKIIGVCPKVYESGSKALDCDEKIVTLDINEATITMINQCDEMIVFPGGVGTLYELFVAIQCKICQEHSKPIIIYNSGGFYSGLIDYLKNLQHQGFISEEVVKDLRIANTETELINCICT